MAGEVELYVDGSTNYTLKVDDKDWTIAFGASTFSPAVLKILGTIFGDETIPNLIVYFGKFSETLVFGATFSNDADWHTFRHFATQDSYFNSAKTRFRWGGAGDEFYDGGNNVANMPSNNYYGIISGIKVNQPKTALFWSGTVTFKIGIRIP